MLWLLIAEGVLASGIKAAEDVFIADVLGWSIDLV